MFILSFFSWVWTISMISGLFFAWRSAAIVLKTAHIVVGRTRIDVFDEMRKIPLNQRSKAPVLQHLLDMVTCEDIHKALQRVTPTTHNQTQTTTPLCYIDITYTCPPTWWWRDKSPAIYRHVYAIDQISSRIRYPPTYKTPSITRSIKSATLIFRNCASTTAVSVKHRLLPLGGQMGDYHHRSEYQLRKHVLEVVLEPEIATLMHENKPLCTEPQKGMTSPIPPLSVRLVFEYPEGRTKVINLEYNHAFANAS